jgi:hypothetical protein
MSERDIFIAALQQEDPAQRRAFLDQACAGQPQLRRQVEDLLRLYQGAGSFLEKPAAEPQATGAFQDGAEQVLSLEASGSLIGPYKLIEPIGEGGHAVGVAMQSRWGWLPASQELQPANGVAEEGTSGSGFGLAVRQAIGPAGGLGFDVRGSDQFAWPLAEAQVVSDSQQEGGDGAQRRVGHTQRDAVVEVAESLVGQGAVAMSGQGVRVFDELLEHDRTSLGEGKGSTVA